MWPDKALAQQIEIHNRWPSPREHDLRSLRAWLTGDRRGNKFLIGRDENAWDEELGLCPDDFVAVANTGDILSNRVASWMLALVSLMDRLTKCERTIGTDRVHSFAGRGYQRIINTMTTIVATVLLVAPIVVLYAVKDMTTRVGLIFVFTVLLSGALSFVLSMNVEKVIMITTG